MKSGRVALFTGQVEPLATVTYVVPATEAGSSVTVRLTWDEPAAMLTLYRTPLECGGPPIVAPGDAPLSSDPCAVIAGSEDSPRQRIIMGPGGVPFTVHVVGDARLRQRFTVEAVFYSGYECL
jgi:hypothetical protein